MNQKIHFVGIGGSGISGVAHLAEKTGFTVSGCDLEQSTAYNEHIFKGHDPKHIKDIDLVVTSPALFYAADENEEIEAAKKAGKLVTWQKFVADYLTEGKKVICIAGTHGKSTTTAMAGKLLTDAGLDPMVVIGANVPEWGGNYRFGKGKYIVIEADEFNDNFLNYRPDIIVLNNIEFDHPDYFKNEEEVKKSFDKFIGNLVGEKILITQQDSPRKKFNLRVFGEHNQKNANMVFVLGKKLGIKEAEIIGSLETFGGIGRRMELIADRGGIKIFDDYAHHPTAIRTTIDGLRAEFPKARIIVVDEPHGFKRTKALLENYRGAFDNADKVYIGPIFIARDKLDPSVTPGIVAEKSGHKNAKGYNSISQIRKELGMNLRKGDIVLVMGAGKSYLWARQIAKLVQARKLEPVTDKSFRDITTFRVGGDIGYYLELENKEEVSKYIPKAKKTTHKIFIIGDGSDILVSDTDFDDFVIKYIGKSISFSNYGHVVVEAGVNWDTLVDRSISKGLQGIECLSGIPGTCGAAPVQNIGAYGQELKDVFVSLEAYNIEDEKFVEFSKEDCKFGYRESIFKQKDYWQKYLITSVTLKLVKNGKPEVRYDSLKSYLAEKGIKNPSLREVRDAVITIRSGKFEDPKKVGNAGSFFKNPIISAGQKETLVLKHADAKVFSFGDKFKVAAGWLIEKAGWKGKSYKSAGVSTMHALILLNKDGKAKAEDIYELSEQIIKDIGDKFDIKLEREVQLINFS